MAKGLVLVALTTYDLFSKYLCDPEFSGTKAALSTSLIEGRALRTAWEYGVVELERHKADIFLMN